MEVRARAPGKIILAGEHAVVHGSTAVAAAIDLYTYVSLRFPTPEDNDDALKLQLKDVDLEFSWPVGKLKEVLPELGGKSASSPSSCSLETAKAIDALVEELNLADAKIGLASGISAFLWLYTSIHGNKPAKVVVNSELPLGSGLGSSAALCVALSAALLALSDSLKLDFSHQGWQTFGDSELDLVNKWAFEGEKMIHGRPSGIDNTVSTFGNMIKFRSGELTRIKTNMPLKMLVTNTKVGRNTRALVAGVSERAARHGGAMTSVFKAVDSISNEVAAIIQSPVSDDLAITEKEEKLGEERKPAGSSALATTTNRIRIMGVEIQSKINDDAIHGAATPLILGLQPSALVDHVARVDCSLLSRIPGESGGSFPVAAEELKFVLSEVNNHFVASPEKGSSLKTIAGGSVANTIRGLAAGFGITCGIIGACGDDDEGSLFIDNMSFYKVDLSRLRLKIGPTAQCVCLVDELGNRTMRPCLSSAVKVQADDLTTLDLRGSRWLVMRYGIFNIEVIQAAIKIAKQEGVSVSLDLASFEMVRKFRLPLLQLLESGGIDLCFANEDEAAELLSSEEKADPESALEFLGKHCRWAVVTLGAKGCIAKHGKEVVRIPAIGESKAVDATGAGDLFASGFLYGLVKGRTLEECCKIGSCSGGSVIRELGGEVTRENWQWMYKQMQTKGLPIPDHNNFVYEKS